eukprot:3403051-Rhodomonas_salina.2
MSLELQLLAVLLVVTSDMSVPDIAYQARSTRKQLLAASASSVPDFAQAMSVPDIAYGMCSMVRGMLVA